MKQMTILTAEPLKDWEPNDVRNWLKKNTEQCDLAAAMSMVWNKTGWLHHGLDDDPPTVTKRDYCKWRKLEEELFHMILATLESEIGTRIDLADTGWIRAIAPFMERNGFFNSGGWWIKKK